MSESTCLWPGCASDQQAPEVFLCLAHCEQIHAMVERERSLRRMERESAKRKSREREGVVYYLLVGDLVKVGFSSDLRKRLLEYPPHAELLAIEPGSMELEAQRHIELRLSLSHGREWFHRTAEVDAHIAQVLSDHGKPTSRHRRASNLRPRQFPVTVTRIGA